MCPEPAVISPEGSTFRPTAPICTVKVGGTMALVVGWRKKTKGSTASSGAASASEGADSPVSVAESVAASSWS